MVWSRDKADENSRRELRRRERERHRQDREHDRNDGHDRGGDAAEDDLGDAGVVVDGNRVAGIQALMAGLVSSSDESTAADGTEDQGDDQRPNQKSAPQPVNRGSDQNGQAFEH